MPNLFSKLLSSLRRLLRPRPEPQDPYSHIHAVLRTGPRGRNGAVALEEPPDVRPVLSALGRTAR